MSEPQKYDAVIIGGGHNGLVCACYLAAAGLKVRVLERRSVVGGAAVTEEFFPGFRNSTASYTVSLLHPQGDPRLRLARARLADRRAAGREFPAACGRRVISPSAAALQRRRREVAQVFRARCRSAAAYYAMLERVADVLRELLLETPPNVGGGVATRCSAR